MGFLVERSDQVVPMTDIARKAKSFFERVATGEQDRFVVMKRSSPVAVMMNVSVFESMMDELEMLRSEVDAYRRDAVNDADLLTEDQLRQRIGMG